MVKVTDSLFRPSPPTSLSLAPSFTLWYVAIPSQAEGFYGYYDFICDPLAPSSPSLGHVAVLMAQFHRPHANGSSPGKNVIFVALRLPSIHDQVTERILDFGG